jgi:hypothetical protein
LLRWCCDGNPNQALGLSIGFLGHAGLRTNAKDNRAAQEINPHE